MVTFAMWLTWSARTDHRLAVVSFTVSCLACLATGSVAWPNRRLDPRVVAAGAAVAGIAATAPLGMIEVAAVGCGVALYLPQGISALRLRSLPGVSTASWLLACAEESIWGAWAIAVGHPILAWPVIIAIPITAVVVRAAGRGPDAAVQAVGIQTGRLVSKVSMAST